MPQHYLLCARCCTCTHEDCTHLPAHQWLERDNNSCVMLCCVQLVSSVGPCFLLHCMPTSWEASNQPRNNLAKTISCAGEGQGLQVFPGSVQEVTPVSRAEGRRLDWVGRLPWGDLDRLDSLRQLQHTLCMLQVDVLQRLVVSGCLG